MTNFTSSSPISLTLSLSFVVHHSYVVDVHLVLVVVVVFVVVVVVVVVHVSTGRAIISKPTQRRPSVDLNGLGQSADH